MAECHEAAAIIGPLGAADAGSIDTLADPVLRRRARHVITECRRVRDFVAAVERGALDEAGSLLTESHHSLAVDFEVSTPRLDALVSRLASLDGVLGARLTGAGFGGCVVVLARSGALDPGAMATRAWRVEAVDGTLAAAERGVPRPVTARPGTAEPGTAEPGTARPGTAEPGTAEPGTAEPGPRGRGPQSRGPRGRGPQSRGPQSR